MGERIFEDELREKSRIKYEKNRENPRKEIKVECRKR